MADSCCHEEKPNSEDKKGKRTFDYILWVSLVLVALGYIFSLLSELFPAAPAQMTHFSNGVFDLMNSMWWGLALAIAFVGALNKIPREIIMGILGTNKGLKGILRATLAGLALDLCNHGVLVVGMKLYERGATIGQTIAFLVASPWNSFSMTLILIALIGVSKTIIFIVLSCIIAIASGLIFEKLVEKDILPGNPNTVELPSDLNVWKEIRLVYANSNWSLINILNTLLEGLKESKMILRWILFGVVLASLLRTFLHPEDFQTYFGPSLAGLGLTIIGATIIEVCSEGSAPIAADLVTIAKAPGNGFTFLMTGVSTDYTEIILLRETTKSWKISFFLPLVTVPQIVVFGYILNNI